MDRRAFLASAVSPVLLELGCRERRLPAAPGTALPSTLPGATDRLHVLDGMRRATRFLTERASHEGGYVWAYLPDFSRSWGELEARRTMLWVQPPGTPSVGHLLLDALHATGDELYLRAALAAARALLTAQHPSGGWSYVYDFEGAAALARWYATYARNAWRMEEFQQQPDSSTFDDACTASATQFLLRLQLEPALSSLPDAAPISAAVARALTLVRISQYPSGGWPQRYPAGEDYSRFVTFNDDVLFENVRTLLLAHAALGVPDLLGPLRAAMACVLALQQPAPQPGWALQHDERGKPASARGYEPAALATHATAANIELLLGFHELTGDAQFTRRVPEALDWLERVRLTPEQAQEHDATHPTFIEVGSDEPLFVHRRGSNVLNGSYYADKSFAPRLAHYSPVRRIDLAPLRARLDELRSRRTPLPPLIPGRPGSVPLPSYFGLAGPSLRQVCTGEPAALRAVGRDEALGLVDALDAEGRWLAPLEQVSNAYHGPGSSEPYLEGTYASTHVGDRSDTSPYPATEQPVTYTTSAPARDGDPGATAPVGISVAHFLRNMTSLIAYLGQSGP